MPRTIYVDREKLSLSREKFVEMLKKEKEEHDKLTKELMEEK